MFIGPRNWFQGMNSASLCSLADRYDNPIPPRFLAPTDFLKIPGLVALWEQRLLENWPIWIRSSDSEPIGNNEGGKEIFKYFSNKKPFLQYAFTFTAWKMAMPAIHPRLILKVQKLLVRFLFRPRNINFVKRFELFLVTQSHFATLKPIR
jgi:hypothetical protein